MGIFKVAGLAGRAVRPPQEILKPTLLEQKVTQYTSMLIALWIGFLISEITKNVDSMFFSSMFLNVMPGEKIKMGPLWDFDLSFGNGDYADSRYAEGLVGKVSPMV